MGSILKGAYNKPAKAVSDQFIHTKWLNMTRIPANPHTARVDYLTLSLVRLLSEPLLDKKISKENPCLVDVEIP